MFSPFHRNTSIQAPSLELLSDRTNLITGVAPLIRVPSPKTDHSAVFGAVAI